jgi:hypothetical protein
MILTLGLVYFIANDNASVESFASPVRNGSQAANQMFFAFPVLKLTPCF